MEFKNGNIVAYKSHPYIDKNTNIKIAAYADYTAPLLIIKAVKEKSFNKDTGKDIPQQLHCQYYNSRDGKFSDKWINANLVNYVFFSIVNHRLLYDFDFQNDIKELELENDEKKYEKLIEKKYLHNKVVLKTVDLELSKVKINRTKDNGDLAETNHMEFLSPVMTVIGYKFLDDKSKFCEKTGIPLIELKCKWYNSNNKSFSESFFPYEILYQVKEIQNIVTEKDLLSELSAAIEENSLYNFPLPQPFVLEGNETIKISKTIALPLSLIFKHYFYQVSHLDYINQNRSVITIDQDFIKVAEGSAFGKTYPYYDKGYKINVSNCHFIRNQYYHIMYEDTFSNRTKRIIKINELFIFIKNLSEFEEKYDTDFNIDNDDNSAFVKFNYHDNGSIFIQTEGNDVHNNTIDKSVFKDPNVEILIHANCLLRKGKFRNFKLNKILEVKEIINGTTLFEDNEDA